RPPIAEPMIRPQAETRSVIAAPSRRARPQPPLPKPKIARSPTSGPPGGALFQCKGALKPLSGRHVDLEPLLGIFLYRAVGDRFRERLVELGRQIRIALADTHALANPEHAADELRPNDGEFGSVRLRGRRHVGRKILEHRVETAGLEVEVAVVGGLVFLNRRDVLEILAGEVGVRGRDL